jgi:hypothetical protein
VSYTFAIEQALLDWKGDSNLVVSKDFNDDTEVMIVHNENGYSLLRAFVLGDRVEVSCDLQDVSAQDVMAHLLARADY